MKFCTKKQMCIVGVFLIFLVGISLFLFFREDFFVKIQKNTPLSQINNSHIKENKLYKKVQVINQLIAEFQLDKSQEKPLYYKENILYKPLSLDVLLKLNNSEFERIKFSLKENGVFVQNSNGSYSIAKRR